jgi:hypothetical protein
MVDEETLPVTTPANGKIAVAAQALARTEAGRRTIVDASSRNLSPSEMAELVQVRRG